MHKQSSTGRGIAPPSSEVIAVDCLPYLKYVQLKFCIFLLPLIPSSSNKSCHLHGQDKLEDVLPHIEGKAEQLACDWLAEGEASHTPTADLVASPGQVPAPSPGIPVQDTATKEKKRHAASSVDEVVETVMKRPRSPHHGKLTWSLISSHPSASWPLFLPTFV
jgi:hypothetical protein